MAGVEDRPTTCPTWLTSLRLQLDRCDASLEHYRNKVDAAARFQRSMEDPIPARTWSQICDVLERGSKGKPCNLRGLREELIELLEVTGFVDYSDLGAEENAIWREPMPSHSDLHDGFCRVADAENPLHVASLRPELLPELCAAVRRRWAARRAHKRPSSPLNLRQLHWDTLSRAEQDDFRSAARHLADYHGTFVRKGRIQKSALDTVLEELALIWVRRTGQSISLADVPYSANSQFIQFAVLVLGQVGQHFEVSPQALSRRWERIVLPQRKERFALEDLPES